MFFLSDVRGFIPLTSYSTQQHRDLFTFWQSKRGCVSAQSEGQFSSQLPAQPSPLLVTPGPYIVEARAYASQTNSILAKLVNSGVIKLTKVCNHESQVGPIRSPTHSPDTAEAYPTLMDTSDK